MEQCNTDFCTASPRNGHALVRGFCIKHLRKLRELSYEAKLAEIHRLFGADPETREGKKLDALLAEIESEEKEYELP